MNHLPTIATFGYDFSLSGWPVWTAAGVGGGLAILLMPQIRLAPRAKVFIQVIAPILMLWYLWFTRWLDSYSSSFFFYKYYHAQLDVAYVVAYAFGIAFCTDSVRSTAKPARISGMLLALIYVGLIPLMTDYVRGMHHWYEARP